MGGVGYSRGDSGVSGKAATAAASSSGGLGFGGALFLVFLVLKLIGQIDWSWWWVTAPLWGPIAALIVLFVVAMALTGLDKFLDRRDRKKAGRSTP